MDSKSIVRKDMRVRFPHPARFVGAHRDNERMGHIRAQSLVNAGLRLSDMGVLDSESAAICGVAVKTVRRWRRLYQRRGQARGQVASYALCPRCDGAPLNEPAYALLLGWYLGDGHIVEHRGRAALLAVFNDVRYPNNSDEAAQSMQLVKAGGPAHRRYRGHMRIDACGWRHWPCLFPQHGPARKHERSIELTDWQRAILQRHPHQFVRGLFHSDGCRVTNSTHKVVAGQAMRYEYPRYFFNNESDDIMRLAEWALDLLGVAHRRARPNSLSVARKASVAIMDQVVGPQS